MEPFVSSRWLLQLAVLRMTTFRLDSAEILETRTVDGTDQQEYFVHYLNCKCSTRASPGLNRSSTSLCLVDHRNDQWITEDRLSANTASEQTEHINEPLNDSMNSSSGRKRARLKRRLNDVSDPWQPPSPSCSYSSMQDFIDSSHETSFEATDQNARKDYKVNVTTRPSSTNVRTFLLSSR